MLKSEDKIFKNLYNEFGWDIDNAIKRDDWKNTKEIISKGSDQYSDPLGHRGETSCNLLCKTTLFAPSARP